MLNFKSIETYEKYKNDKKILKEIQKAKEKHQKRVEFYDRERKKQIEKQQSLIEAKMRRRLQKDESLINLRLNKTVCLKTSKKVPKKYLPKPSLAKVKKEVYTRVQLLARLMDVDSTGFGHCISCGKKIRWNQGDGWHYIPRGHMATAFDLRNIHLQCKYCNWHLHGNLVEYRKWLIKKHGIKFVEELESLKNTTKKYTIEELETLIKDLDIKINEAKKNIIDNQ